jgi:hypothetical protein
MGEHGQSELENWKIIPTFPNYEICSDGRVRNRETGKYLKIVWINGTGNVFLYYGGRVYGRSIARLLKKLFNIQPPSKSVSTLTKCPSCGESMSRSKLKTHLKTCTPRDPNIKYFEY